MAHFLEEGHRSDLHEGRGQAEDGQGPEDGLTLATPRTAEDEAIGTGASSTAFSALP